MFRRKPTAITITPEDITAFEEARLRKKLEESRDGGGGSGGGQPEYIESEFTTKKYDPNDELKPLPGDKARIVRSRDERIGLGRR